MFKAILIEKDEQGYRSNLAELDESRLPESDVTVNVEFSTLNYKDALAITGKGPIVRSFPLVPGIDLAGTVAQSNHPQYQSGDKVVLNGWGVGESHWGGLSQKAALNGDWLIPLPKGLTTRQAMEVGTAGYTAMLCVIALERHGVTPDDGDVVVTGASGGVGSFAISFLAARGYNVVAVTGKMAESEYLKGLGASEIVDRNSLSEPGKPLQKERWAAAVDSVGSHTLANVCASLKADGAVAACGMAQGLDFPGSVAPFILRGVSLLGINSVTRPYEERVVAWQMIADHLKTNNLKDAVQEIDLNGVQQACADMMDGKVSGRFVVKTGA